MSRYRILEQIKTLHPERDDERIAFLSSAFDFPFDTRRAYELALVRTFCVPRSSRLLVATRELTERTQKRYDDTVILISTIGSHGYSSDLGARAIRRMNQLHGRYKIPNDEFLYVLSTFIYEPIRWNARFGWRPLHEHEKQAGFYFWREVGRRMGLHDLPESYEAFEAYNVAYEREHFAYSPNNQLLADATLDLFVSWVLPKWLPKTVRRPLAEVGKDAAASLMDAPMRGALGLPAPRPWIEKVIFKSLRHRALAQLALPPRRTPYTLPPTRTYPEGVDLESVGPAPAGKRGPRRDKNYDRRKTLAHLGETGIES